jgi:hypothetical protein
VRCQAQAVSAGGIRAPLRCLRAASPKLIDMNAILERFIRINKSRLSADSALGVVHEGNYIFFQTVARQQGQVPLRLFAIDIDQQKLVLDMLATGTKSPHRKIHIDTVQGFYTRHDAQGDIHRDYLYAVTPNERELEVSTRYSPSTRDTEEIAMALAFICNKPLWRDTTSAEMTPLDTSRLSS